MPRITAIHRFRPRQDDQSHVILVDEDGDLKLLIGAGTEQREFHVCSKTLARASQVFRGIVRAKPVALQANLEWVVELPEDDPEAAADPLYITHGMKAFVGGETDPTPEGLLAILTFADRYALKSWLRPSAPSWIPRGPVNSQTCESEEDFASVVALAWGFGLRADFLLVTRRLATEFGADECGRLVGANQQAIAAVAERAGLLSLIPHGYFEFVQKHRLDLLAGMFERLATIIERLRSAASRRTARVCILHDGRAESCDSAILGSLGAALEYPERRVWFLSAGERIRIDHVLPYPPSPNHFVQKVEAININCIDGHDGCNPLPMLLEDCRELLRSINTSFVTAYGGYLYIGRLEDRLETMDLSFGFQP